MCPLAATVSFEAVAAIAENSASRVSFLGMRRAIFFWDVGGWGCLPPTVLGANAAFPAPLFMRGTRAIPMPVPRDSAVVLFPAMGSLPWGWRLCDCMVSTVRFITSGRNGVSKTVGSVVFVVGFPWRSYMVAVFWAVVGMVRFFSYVIFLAVSRVICR